jgi:serine/threonine protein phosphatase 1
MRTLVVGDIHGGLRGLEQVLERASVTSSDLLIFVGDYVDGWSESAQVISFLLELSKTHSCKFLRGNHEELAFEFFFNDDKTNSMWLDHGGRSTIESYQGISSEEIQLHFNFMKNLDNYFIDNENRLYVHAGFTHPEGPAHEFYPNFVYWDRTLWELACTLNPTLSVNSDIYPKRLKLFKEIFIGHTPVTRMGSSVPMNAANVWNVEAILYTNCIPRNKVEINEPLAANAIASPYICYSYEHDTSI